MIFLILCKTEFKFFIKIVFICRSYHKFQIYRSSFNLIQCEPGIFYHNIVILDFVCTTMNAAVDMIMRNMSIITTITTMNAAADMIIMIITIITQMKVFTSWGRETIKKYTREGLEKMLEALSASEDYGIILERDESLEKTEHGFILTWFRRKQRSVKVHRNTQVVSA